MAARPSITARKAYFIRASTESTREGSVTAVKPAARIVPRKGFDQNTRAAGRRPSTANREERTDNCFFPVLYRLPLLLHRTQHFCQPVEAHSQAHLHARLQDPIPRRARLVG